MITTKSGGLAAAVAFVLLVCSGSWAQQPGSESEADEEARLQMMRIMQISQVIDSGRLTAQDMAEAHRMRGVMFSNLYQHDLALKDFNRSIELAPDNGKIYVDRGVTFHTVKQYDKALDDFAQAIQLMPDFSHAYISRGHLFYYQGKFDEAIQDFSEGASFAKPEDFLYGTLWHYLATMRAGRDGKKGLQELVGDRDLKPWPGIVARLFMGQATPEEVLAAVKGDAKQSLRMQQCEAQFYVGQYYLLNGERERAREAFGKTVDTGVKMYIEYMYAQVELERLARQ